jgi:acyl-CoA thioesterase-1
MRAAPNLGDAYGDAFARVFVDLARANGAMLIPFLLDGVAAVPELNQADGIHPNARGHRVIADSVWPVLEPLLRAEGRVLDAGAPP